MMRSIQMAVIAIVKCTSTSEYGIKCVTKFLYHCDFSRRFLEWY